MYLLPILSSKYSDVKYRLSFSGIPDAVENALDNPFEFNGLRPFRLVEPNEKPAPQNNMARLLLTIEINFSISILAPR
ncbi:hypothetical protein D3C72_1318380 [compost metagenome]